MNEEVSNELFGWDTAILEQFRERFAGQLDEFVAHLVEGHGAWTEFDRTVEGNEQRAHISALIFGALNLHTISTKLLIWGLLVPSGNTMRQVLETICMALLGSKLDLNYLERYAAGQYSTNNSVRDVLKHAERLNLARDALETLRDGRDFYHQFSHPTLMTVATFLEIGGGGNAYFGAAFDSGKVDAYRKEINTRVQVAALLPNMVAGIRRNLDE